MKPLVICLTSALAFLIVAKHFVLFGDSYGAQSLAIHVVILFAGWLGYILSSDLEKET